MNMGPSERSHRSANLVRLQAFLELTDRTITFENDTELRELLGEFAACFYSDVFLDHTSNDIPWIKYQFFHRQLPLEVKPYIPFTVNRSLWRPEFVELTNHLQLGSFDPTAVEFWKGWDATNAAGRRSYLSLWRFWRKFGPEKTRELHAAIRQYQSTTRGWGINSIVSEFTEFVYHIDGIALNDSSDVGRSITDFFHEHFHKKHRSGKKISNLILDWRRFAQFLNNHVLGKSWASAVPAVPQPPIKRQDGSRSGIRRTEGGSVVKVTLLTQIPLHVTDSKALDLLFVQIEREVDAVHSWAKYEVAKARLRMDNRISIAPTGTVMELAAAGINTGARYRLSRECPEHLAHAAATFEQNKFNHLLTPYAANRFYPQPTSKTAWDLGLPTPQLLLAYATLLVRQHPKITPAFLSELSLFDESGKQVGLVKLDAGWYLRGLKRRRGVNLAEQEILLTPSSLQVVLDLIELTRPLRTWMREQGDPEWRHLFLCVASMGCSPSKWSADHEASRNNEWLSQRFQKLAASNVDDPSIAWLSDPTASLEFAQRFSLRRLRASAGVLVYLETGSVEAMAAALGHAKWSPQLLDRYLPRPVQEFFVDRWIRLFQNGLLCEALKESPFILEVTDFTTMEELDEFLEHHALKKIPHHLENPGFSKMQEKQGHSSVLFGIEPGILAVLMSLEVAVRTSIRPVCGRAVRWARISQRLVRHLEVQTEQPEFHAILAKARRQIDPGKMCELIHA